MNLPCPRSHDLGPAEAGAPLAAFVHGLEDTWQSWFPLAAHLAPRWRCRALELPWRAGNDYLWRRAATPGQWVGAALDGLGEPIHAVVAHSFGAAAVLELLATASAPTIGAAVLAAPFYRPSSVAVSWKLLDRSRARFEEQVREGLRVRLAARRRPVSEDMLDAITAKALDRIGPDGFLTVFDQFVLTGRLPLAAVTVPSLVLAAQDDPSLTAEQASALAGEIPGACLVVTEGYDHFCHLTQAAGVAAVVIEFVEGRHPAAVAAHRKGEKE